MEIENEYANLEPASRAATGAEETNLFLKETLLHSPIFIDIIPNFVVWTNKPVSAVRATSAHDASDQYKSLQEEDSQFDVFNDDEDDLLFGAGEKPVKLDVPENVKPKLSSVKIIIKASSLLVNGTDYPFNSCVRSACVVRGIRNEDTQEEDSLFVSLKSGFLLLIRIFYVPKGFSDTEYAEIPDVQAHNMVFKPFVVQWWDASNSNTSVSLLTSGRTVSAHDSSLSVVSTSAANVFRIYNCIHAQTGILFQPHHNVTVNGSILHSCFASPIKGSALENHVMFLALVFTDTRRLELSLFQWSTSAQLPESLTKSTLPLRNTFVPPVFITALPNSSSFLFVADAELVVVTIHDITSAVYNFRSCAFPGSFPTCFYHPEYPIIAETEGDSVDEVLIGTDNGTIYAVIIIDNSVASVRPIARISDPLSVFTLEKSQDGLLLTYGSDMGLNRELLIKDLLDGENSPKPPYSKSMLLKDYKNWAPIMDVQIIDSYHSRNMTQHATQELWCISGVGKRARLSQLRKGHCIRRVSEPYAGLRKIEKMSFLSLHNTFYVLCSLPFETILLEYQPHDEDDEFALVEEAALVTQYPTLSATVFNNLLLQVTTKSMSLTTVEQNVFSMSVENAVIVFSDVIDDILLLISQKEQFDSQVLSVELVRIKPVNSLNFEVEYDALFEQLASVDVNYQISYAKLARMADTIVLFMGTFDGQFLVFKTEESLVKPFLVLNLLSLAGGPNEDLQYSSFTPNDTCVIADHKQVLIATKDGNMFSFSFNDNLNMEFENCIKFCNSSIQLQPIYGTPSSLFVVAKSVWLIDFDKEALPEAVLLDDRNDRPTKYLLPIPAHPGSGPDQISVIFLRDEGLSIGTVDTYQTPSIRQIHLGESAKRFLYLPFISLFAVLSNSKNVRARLRFVDRKAFKSLSHAEFNSRSVKLNADSSIFDVGETPVCASIWSVDRYSKVSKKLLIGAATDNGTGSFKILDVSKLNAKDESSALVKLSELTSFSHPEPITNIQQIASTILFSSGRCVYSTTYNVHDKKLTPVSSLMTLSSEISSMTVSEDLYVNISTKLDSFYQFTYQRNDDLSENLTLVARDPSPKSIINHARLNSKIVVGEKLHSDVLVLSNNNKNLIPELTLTSAGVPRVFPVKFLSSWMNDKVRPSSVSEFICVNVDGEIVLVKELSKNSPEYRKLSTMFKSNSDEVEFSTDRWDVQFVDKITGKGLRAINRPYFGNRITRGNIIDYDLEEVARSFPSTTTL